MKIRKWIRPALFTLGGALAGLAYYYFIGCASGSCPITSSPFGSMLYMGVIGYLVSALSCVVYSKQGKLDYQILFSHLSQS